MNICLFQSEELTRPLPLHDARAVHILTVLHKKCGDQFTAGVIGGASGLATITRLGTQSDRDGGSLDFVFTATGNGKPLHPVTLIVGFPRPIQLRRLLRDIAGLGCARVVLTGTALGEKSYMQSSLVARGAARQLLVDGTVQAGSTHVPELELYRTLPECLAALCGGRTALQSTDGNFAGGTVCCPETAPQLPGGAAGEPPPEIRIALDTVPPAPALTTHARTVMQQHEASPHVLAAIGSERGWTDAERALLESYGFVRCRMGERILRTESAATVAAALLLSELGVLD